MISPNAGINPNFQRYVGGVASAETVDDHTVRIKSKTADADFLSNLSQRNPVIVPAKVLQSGGSLSKQAIGTGPFRLAAYTKDGSGEATRYENYWQKDRPYLDGVKMTLKADDATMGAAFAAGRTDIITRTDQETDRAAEAGEPEGTLAHLPRGANPGTHLPRRKAAIQRSARAARPSTPRYRPPGGR